MLSPPRAPNPRLYSRPHARSRRLPPILQHCDPMSEASHNAPMLLQLITAGMPANPPPSSRTRSRVARAVDSTTRRRNDDTARFATTRRTQPAGFSRRPTRGTRGARPGARPARSPRRRPRCPRARTPRSRAGGAAPGRTGRTPSCHARSAVPRTLRALVGVSSRTVTRPTRSEPVQASPGAQGWLTGSTD